MYIIAIYIRFNQQNKQGFYSCSSIEHPYNLESLYRIELHLKCLITSTNNNKKTWYVRFKFELILLK